MNNNYFNPYTNFPYRSVNPTSYVRSAFPAASAVRAPSILPAIAGGTKSFSFSGLLNGASKTLGVINQAIPVFNQVKPIWSNAKTMFRVVKELNKNEPVKKDEVKNETIKTDQKESNTSTNNSNNPNFFL